MSVESVYAKLEPMCQEFIEEGSKSKGEVALHLATECKSFPFLSTTCFYRDILLVQNTLSKCFQYDLIDYEYSMDLVSRVKLGVRTLYLSQQLVGGSTLKRFMRVQGGSDTDTFHWGQMGEGLGTYADRVKSRGSNLRAAGCCGSIARPEFRAISGPSPYDTTRVSKYATVRTTLRSVQNIY